MRKNLLIPLFMMLFMIAMSPQRVWAVGAQPTSGDGTAANPYQIGTADELLWFMTEASSATLSKRTAYNAELTADIVINQNVLKADGTLNGTPSIQWVMPEYFYGTFDGKGHTISGIYCASGNDGTAMFKHNSGTIRNLGVLDSYFYDNGYHVATFTAYNNGTITDCYSFATVDGTLYCGGIAGSCTSELSNCFYAGKITTSYSTSAPICSDYNGSDQTSNVVHNNYFLASCLNSGMRNLRSTSVTLDEMKSGKIAFYLQSNRETAVWGQNITTDPKDEYPVLGGPVVCYSHLTCDGEPAEDAVLSNNSQGVVRDSHEYENYMCTGCGQYTAPEVGNGSSNNPYKLANASNLLWFMTQVKNDDEEYYCAELTADIVINQNVLKADGALNGTPAVEWVMPENFYGNLNGQGHTISGIYNPASNDGTAMFVKNYGTIRNLGVLDSYFGTDKFHTATFAGYNRGTITDCYSFATIDGTSYNGGIAGESDTDEISNCFFAGKMTSTVDYSAPICSDNDGDDITNKSVHNNYFLASCLNEGMKNFRSTSVTLDEMKSGKVACLLQAARATAVWGQTLSGEDKQDYPVLGGATVYADKLNCDGKTPAVSATFTNEAPAEVSRASHSDADNDGFCDVCGYLTSTEAPVLVTAENYVTLGLTADYIGYKAISSLGQLAGFAEEMGSPMSRAEEVETSSPSVSEGVVSAPKRNGAKEKNAHAPRRSAARKENAPVVPITKYVLTADITVNSNLFKQDGTVNEYDSNNAFRNLIAWNAPDLGSMDEDWENEVSAVIFDGNNKSISGLYQNMGADANLKNNWAGYFGFAAEITSSSVVKNLGITGSYFTNKAGNAYLSSIAAYSEGTVENCWSDASIDACYGYEIAGLVADVYGGKITGSSYSGTISLSHDNTSAAGIAFYVCSNNNVEISDCHFSGKVIVKGDECEFGGVSCSVYSSEDATVCISNCYADGEIVIKGDDLSLSGLVQYVGINEKPIYISNCYNVMTISNSDGADYDMAGLVNEVYNDAYEDSSLNSSLTNCFSYGSYTDADNHNPLVGSVYSGVTFDVSNCYYLANVRSAKGGRTAAQFASGEVAYRLNGNRSAGTTESPLVWYQALGEEGNEYPVLEADEDAVVYASSISCDGTIACSNTPNESGEEVVAAEHVDEDHDGFCDTCHNLISEAPVLVTAENYATLGLTDDYIGYKAIGNLAQLAGFAEEMNAPMTIAEEITASQSGGGLQPGVLPVSAPRKEEVSGETSETSAGIKYVLTADIVVNKDLLDEDGKPNDYDEDGDFRTDLLAWNSPMLMNTSEMRGGGPESPRRALSLPFTQYIFDGNGHTISGLYQNCSVEMGETGGVIGFASMVGPGSSIKNLGIKDSYFYAEDNSALIAGSIVGLSYGGTIENCWSDATVEIKSQYGYVGGIVGQIMIMGGITGSSYSGHISAPVNSNPEYISFAGIAGTAISMSGVTISDCHFSGTATTNYCPPNGYGYFSGILGTAQVDYGALTIDKCYADGEVSLNANMYVCGIVNGIELNGSHFQITNSYNALKVDANRYYYTMCGIFDYVEQDNQLSESSMIAYCFSYGDYDDAWNYYPIIGSTYMDLDYLNTFFNFYLGDSPVVPGGVTYTSSSPLRSIIITDPSTPIAVSEEDFATGEIAYGFNYFNAMMNGGVQGGPQAPRRTVTEEAEPSEETEPSATPAPVWYQNLGEDKYPVLKGDEYTVVYYDDEEETYYNLARKFAEYELADGEEYDLKYAFEVEDFTYTREVSESQVNKWQALYVPFQMSYDDWKDDFDVATIQNFHEYTDEDGAVQNTVLEVRYVKSGKLKANHPYLIRPKSAGTKTIELTDVTLAKAEDKSIVCQSIERKYTFTGTYAPKQNLKSDNCLFMTGGSLMTATDDDVTLKAQRWYLNLQDLDSQVENSSAASEAAEIHINISVLGDDDSASGIEEIKAISTPLSSLSGVIYDMQGRRQQNLGKGINLIRQDNGNVDKIMVK